MNKTGTPVLRFKCSPDDAQRWRQAAANARLSFSEYARRCIDNNGPAVAAAVAADRAKAAELTKIREYIRRIGALLNQLTKHAHETKQIQDIANVHAQLEKLRATIERHAASSGEFQQ